MGCFGCLKVVLIIFAVCYILVGLGLLGVSLWLRFDYLKEAADAMHRVEPTDYMNIGLYIAMGIGGFLVLLGIMGCVGAMRISLCLLGNFAVLVVAAIGGLIAVCVLAYLYQDQIVNGIIGLLNTMMLRYGEIPYQASVDALQRVFKCCGSNNGPLDWSTVAHRSVPASCCINPSSTATCVYSPNTTPIVSAINSFGNVINPNPVNGTPTNFGDLAATMNQIFNQGCAQKLRENYRLAMQVLVGLSGGIAGFMLLGFVMCIAFCCVM
ncbi:hypothetical protein BV898_15591 [Hypsibius exemplaris]|uniref:Tetraspanin n=1 Tax=Hypsibius exemplaris TaxID=2072580 RepID=A0A9X6NE80_HYPEX|nr:hypothetical protein BV898_15591 [Hypsibius exemplaris]